MRPQKKALTTNLFVSCIQMTQMGSSWNCVWKSSPDNQSSAGQSIGMDSRVFLRQWLLKVHVPDTRSILPATQIIFAGCCSAKFHDFRKEDPSARFHA